VVSTLNRGTLHLVRAEDYGWLHALTTPPLAAGSARRLAQEGVPPDAAERGITAVVAALAADGPLGRTALRPRVAAAGVRVEGQALVHVLFAATLRWLIVRGPVVDGEHAFVLVRDWLGALGEPWVLAAVTGATCLGQVGLGALPVIAVLLAEQHRHPAAAGWLLTSVAAGGLVGSLAWTWRPAAPEHAPTVVMGGLVAPASPWPSPPSFPPVSR
jgi:hypothetical protein